jgi:hypothetical protein
MYDLPSVLALRTELTEVATLRNLRVDLDRQAILRGRLHSAVDDLRAAGWTPERVIVAIKQIAADAGVHPSRRLYIVTESVHDKDVLLIDMIGWTIQRYFDTGLSPAS